MKNLLSLFRPSAKERAIENELSGKPSTPTRQPATQPPKRGASPASVTPTHTGADVSELSELRASLANIEARLQAAHQERDSLRDEFSQYRQASQADQRELERENARLRESLDITGRELSKMIANGGADGPIPEANGEPERKGLARAIEANKAHQAQTTNQFQRIQRPTL